MNETTALIKSTPEERVLTKIWEKQPKPTKPKLPNSMVVDEAEANLSMARRLVELLVKFAKEDFNLDEKEILFFDQDEIMALGKLIKERRAFSYWSRFLPWSFWARREYSQLFKFLDKNPHSRALIYKYLTQCVKDDEAVCRLLEKDFDSQVDRLRNLGFFDCDDQKKQQIVVELASLKNKLKELLIRKVRSQRKNFSPIVIVPTEHWMSLVKKIPLMEVGGKKGFTTLNLSELKTADGVKIPESLAYLVVDVENGKAMLGRIPDEAVKQFKKEGRSPLTAEEGVAIILQHPEILKDHYMGLPGSRHGVGEVADLWLDGGKPRLSWDWADGSCAKWGSASCGSRVGP